MTREELASLLNGRKYREEITREEAQTAKENNLVVVFGYSDDTMELRGTICDESCGIAKISKNGILERPDIQKYDTDCYDTMNAYDEDFEEYLREKKESVCIEPIWDGDSDFYWTYRIDIPHSTFEIYDEESPYCRGVVFSLDEVKQLVAV